METAIALCAVGAEKVVSNELRKLDLSLVDTGFGKVRFEADTAGLYKALMGLRAADRVLLETACFAAEDFDALFEGTKGVPWEEFIPPSLGIAVAKVRSNRSQLKAITSIQSVVHKAAVERLCEKRGLRRLPEYGPSAEIRVYLEKNRVSLLLDLSGEPLFKRGYRIEGGTAPLRETTAAAILLLANWRRKFPLWDPFCGSGTIVIEAALYAWDMAPGLGRNFALGNLLIADPVLEKRTREEFLSRVDFVRTIRIRGSDADKWVVSIAKANLDRACALVLGKEAAGWRSGESRGLPDFVNIPMTDIRPSGVMPPAEILPGSSAKNASDGFILTNPPYGRRLGDPVLTEAIYHDMAGLARYFPGWKLGVISDHPGFESFFGSKADSCREITNGSVPLYFYQYEQL
jgi:putative N6-adenine-specific DNA methylase